MRYLLIDDQREFGKQISIPEPSGEYSHALTFDQGIFELTVGGPWDVLYLDHDLGDPDPDKTGYGIMKWLEAKCNEDDVQREFFLPKKIVLVTSNPVGRKNMQVVIDKLYGVENG